MVNSPLLGKFLKKHRSLSLDTSVFIYFIEQHPRYYPLSGQIFEAIERGNIKGSTSTISLLEMLVQPYRKKLDDLVMKFYALLTTYPYLTWVDLSLDIADAAAKLRAEYHLKTPDAVQLASALSTGATGFVCNDSAFTKVKEIECLLFDDCLGS